MPRAREIVDVVARSKGQAFRARATSVPSGLRVLTVRVGQSEYAILSAPLPGFGEAGEELSPAELDVARRILDGRSNAEIAAERATSARTVANQLASIYRKLGVGSRAELAATWARRNRRPKSARPRGDA